MQACLSSKVSEKMLSICRVKALGRKAKEGVREEPTVP